MIRVVLNRLKKDKKSTAKGLERQQYGKKARNNGKNWMVITTL